MEAVVMGENREYTYHPYFSHYSAMLYRAERLGLPCDFEKGLESFNRFLNIIGPIPEDMVKPTVGRNDHDKGYVIENGEPNFKWQSKSDNSREMALRTRLARRQLEAGTHNSQTRKNNGTPRS